MTLPNANDEEDGGSVPWCGEAAVPTGTEDDEDDDEAAAAAAAAAVMLDQRKSARRCDCSHCSARK